MGSLTQRLSTFVVIGLCLFALAAAGRGALGVAGRLGAAASAPPPSSSFEVAASVARFIDESAARLAPLRIG